MDDLDERIDKAEVKLLTLVKLVNKSADIQMEQAEVLQEYRIRIRVLEATVERLTGERRD